MASIEWCPECSNLLYPKADTIHQHLRLACRNCPHEHDTKNPCVWRHNIIKKPKQDSDTTRDLIEDRALPRMETTCPHCHLRNRCVFFQAQHGKRAQTSMVLTYVCSKCKKTFNQEQMMQANGMGH